MHELGIVIQIVKQMESFMAENQVEKIDKLVLQIGALSSVYPAYIEDVYPIAVEHSLLKDTELVIEQTPGIGACKTCDFSYDLIENKNICPKCQGTEFRVLTGTEFMIKEIHVPE